MTKRELKMTLKDVILGWECRRSNCSIHFLCFFFGVELKLKKETEKYIAVNNGTLKLNDSNRRWGLFLH